MKMYINNILQKVQQDSTHQEPHERTNDTGGCEGILLNEGTDQNKEESTWTPILVGFSSLRCSLTGFDKTLPRPTLRFLWFVTCSPLTRFRK